MLRALLIDHDDSFTSNIKAWLKKSFEVTLISHRDLLPADQHYDLLVISPGPKSPHDYPHTVQFLASLPPSQPVLGICLGMQIMNTCEGGTVQPYYPPVHGKTSRLVSILSELNDAVVARYHSLACEVNQNFQILANANDLPMIIKHKNKNWLGYQFHPESFLTETPEVFLKQAIKLCHQ